MNEKEQELSLNAIRQEAETYFHKHEIMMKLARGFWEKYKRLDKFYGNVRLGSIPEDEAQQLSLFLRKNVRGSDDVSVSFAQLEKSWAQSKFGKINLCDFLLHLHDGDLLSNKYIKQQKADLQKEIFDKLLKKYKSVEAQTWLHKLLDNSIRLPRKDMYTDEMLLDTVAKALDSLPQEYTKLPIFSNKVTGNPHSLDMNREIGSLFIKALSHLSNKPIESLEEKDHVLSEYMLFRDDIFNFVTVFGITAYVEGKEQVYCRMASENYSVLNIPLRELLRYDKMLPVNLTADMFPVYIVENSGVYSSILDALQNKKIQVPFICLHGQLKAASWLILEILHKSGAVFYYSGDYDPEGLLIAQQIKQRYRDTVFWKYDVKYYQNNSSVISERSLKKLDKLKYPSLIEIADKIRIYKAAYYQEGLLDELIADMCIKKEVQLLCSTNHCQ